MTGKTRPLTRDEKLRNLIVNHSMIFMGMFEEAFADLADRMTDVMAAGASAMADALGGGRKPAKTSRAAEMDYHLKELSPEVRMHIEQVFSEIREELEAQWPKDPAAFTRFISSPSFDRGIEIVEGYDFRRPRLTEKLSDETLASYVFLLKGGDKKLEEMFKELSEWQSGLPKPPWAGGAR